MSLKVYCSTKDKGVQSYYLADGKESYYLFDSAYRVSNKKFFSRGRVIQEVLAARRHSSESVRRTSVRLISTIKYIEGEYDLCVLQKTARKQQKKRSTKMLRKSEREREYTVQ